MFFATRREPKTAEEQMAAAGQTGTDEHGKYVWAFCGYCARPYKDRGGKPVCNSCYLGR